MKSNHSEEKKFSQTTNIKVDPNSIQQINAV